MKLMPLLRLAVFSVALGSLATSLPVVQAWAGEGGGGEPPAKSKEDAKAEAKSKKKEASSITGGQTADDPIYLHLAPLTLPVINDYGAQQLVTMMIDLQIKDLDTAENLQKQMPKLKDGVLQALYSGLADGSLRNAQALDLIKMKKIILETLSGIYGGGTIIEVLIPAVAQRKL